MFTSVVMCVLGTLFAITAFVGSGIGPAFSRRGPYAPVSPAGRAICLLVGLIVLIDGLGRLLGHWDEIEIGWRSAVAIVALFFAALLLFRSKFVRPRLKRDVPTNYPTVVIDFGKRLPRPIIALRIAFGVFATAMVAFGTAPVAGSTAKAGVIACVLSLFGLALVYTLVESHYVNTGRATQINIPARPKGTAEPKRSGDEE